MKNKIKIGENKENYNNYTHQLQKPKKTTKLQKKKQYELSIKKL